MMKNKEYYDYVQNFYNTYSNCNYQNIFKSKKKFIEFSKQYYTIFEEQIRMLLKSKKVARLIFEGLDFDNGKMFHQEENKFYENMKGKDFFEELVGDIYYICDRVSLDRIFRCLWVYRRLSFHAFKEFKYKGYCMDLVDDIIKGSE